MTRLRVQSAAVLLVLVIVVGIVPIPVAAAPDGVASAPLDSGATEVATVEIAGSQYTVYEVNNRIPWASGIEVYADGSRVTEKSEILPVASRLAARRTLEDVDTSVSATSIDSRSAAESQFRVVGWQVAARELGSGDLSQLREIQSTADRIDQLVSPPLQAINDVLSVFDSMKQTGLFGVTVWDIATKAYPSLPQFERTLSQTQSELRAWNDAAERVSNNVRPVIDSLQRAQQGESIDYDRVASRIQTAADGLEQLESKSGEVESTLSSTSDVAGEVADALSASRVPGRFVSPVSDLSRSLEAAAEEIRTFQGTLEESRSQLTDVRSTAESERDSLLSEWESERSSLVGQWKARQSAETRVYGTAGGAGVGTLAIGVFVRRRFLV